MNIMFQLVIGVPFFAMLLYLLKMPESVRWAWQAGKKGVAQKVTNDIAKANGIADVPLLENLLPNPDPPHLANGNQEDHEATPHLTDKSEMGVAGLLKTPPLIPRLLVMAFNWLTVAVGFLGLSFNAGTGSSVFGRFAMSALLEIPGYILCAWVSLYQIQKKITKKIFIFSLFRDTGENQF